MSAPQAVPPDWLGEQLGVRLLGQGAVGGGSIHSAWCLTVEGVAGGRLFAKTNRASALPLLQAEADGLAALARAAAGTGVTVPIPLAIGVAGDRAVLVLPWLAFGQGGGASWRRLGAGLARLHRRSLDLICTAGDRPGQFGWPCDNWIGSAAQANGWDGSWGLFFRDQRLAPQAALLAGRGQPLAGMEELLERVPGWLEGHGAKPCLVHGDFWSGNAEALVSGTGCPGVGSCGAIFDPAVHRADREVDLAMARLFGGFPPDFFAGYEETWPLPADHSRRVDLYNLYHLLNHANHFGGSYRARAGRLIKALLS
jgi:fructosamine-3-kinase